MYRTGDTPRSMTRDSVWLAGAFLAATLAWTLWAGKDLSWDVINHHLYQPFSLLSGRYRVDLFAAGNQSYYNPLGYVPFYLLAGPSTPSWVTGLALALLHGLVAWPLVALTARLWPGRSGLDASRALALALAWSAPLYLVTAGTSSGDPWSTLLVVAAAAAVAGQGRVPLRWGLAGGLIGVACGLKLSNAIFAVAWGTVLVWGLIRRRAGWRDLLAYATAAGAGLVLVDGFWAFELWKRFGNPVFPLFNQWFESPFAPTQPMVDTRFTPHGVLDLVLRPLAWAEYRPYTHTEAFAPDIRPLTLTLLLVPAAVLWFRRRRSGGPATPADGQAVMQDLSGFVGIAAALWLLSSGNGRYAIALFMLLGLLLVRAAEFVMPRRAAHAVLIVVLSAQLTYFFKDGEHRFQPRPWNSRPFVEVQVPDRLKREPFLHLSVGTPSYAAVAPFLDQRGSMTNVMGPMSLPSDGPLGEALMSRIAQWQGRTRILMLATDKWREDAESKTFRARADRIIYRFKLEIDWSDCEEILILRQAEVDPAHPEVGAARLLSCATRPRLHDDPGYARDLAVAEKAFGVLESQCPKVFGPPPMVTDGDLDAWQRRYMNSSARATVSMTDGVLISHFRSNQLIGLGSVADVIAGRGLHACQAWAKLGVR